MRIRQHIPNILTLANLGCGSLAILFVFQGSMWQLVLLFAFCLLFDFLDGLAARVLGVGSELGKQLDSFADLISFGLFPGILMYRHIQSHLSEDYWEYLPFFAILIPIFSSIRLAKFNLAPPREDFLGLPTPANAALILSYVWIPTFHPDTYLSLGLNQPYLLLFLVFLSCFLMLSPIALFSLKVSSLTLSNNWPRYLLIILGGLGLTFYQFLAIPFILLAYILLSLLLNFRYTSTH